MQQLATLILRKMTFWEFRFIRALAVPYFFNKQKSPDVGRSASSGTLNFKDFWTTFFCMEPDLAPCSGHVMHFSTQKEHVKSTG